MTYRHKYWLLRGLGVVALAILAAAGLYALDRNVERTAEVQFETSAALDEMRELLKSLRLLIEGVQRHPESLLRGKPEPKEKK